jgi:hypothetical protein
MWPDTENRTTIRDWELPAAVWIKQVEIVEFGKVSKVLSAVTNVFEVVANQDCATTANY